MRPISIAPRFAIASVVGGSVIGNFSYTCSFAWLAVADLRHIIGPFLWLWRITMLAKLDREWLQGRSQLMPFQPDAAQFCNQPITGRQASQRK